MTVAKSVPDSSLNDNIFASLVKDSDNQLVTYSDTSQGEILDYIPTLIPSVDAVMLGGLPLSGRATEIFGDPNVGKSTLVANLIYTGQKMGIVPVYFDVEGTTSRRRLDELGVDTNHILTLKPKVDKKTGVVTPITIELIFNQILDISTKVHQQNPNLNLLFVWDTVAMTQSAAVAGDDIGAQRVGNQAKSLTEGIRKVNAAMMVNNASLIALNQARDDIGGNSFFGPQIITVGGKAWQHEMTLRLALTRSSAVKEGSGPTAVEIGHDVVIKFAKSKMGDNAGAKAKVTMLQTSGFDIVYNTLNDAIDQGLFKKSGAYLAYGEGKDEQRKYKAAWYEFLQSDKGQPLYYKLWQELIKKLFPRIYPPLFNVHTPLTKEKFPMIDGLREYYIKIQEKFPDKEKSDAYLNWKEYGNGRK